MKYLKSIIAVFFFFASIQIFAQQNNEFTINSSGVNADGSLSIEYTGEGEGVSMPLEWTNIPAGTKYFALNLWHIPHANDPSEVKSYWLVYNIPSNILSLPKNAKGIGIVGYNDKNQAGYDPMKSKGPGVKEYNLTIYALSEKLVFKSNKVYRADLLKAIEGKLLGECTLTYNYVTGTLATNINSILFDLGVINATVNRIEVNTVDINTTVNTIQGNQERVVHMTTF